MTSWLTRRVAAQLLPLPQVLVVVLILVSTACVASPAVQATAGEPAVSTSQAIALPTAAAPPKSPTAPPVAARVPDQVSADRVPDAGVLFITATTSSQTTVVYRFDGASGQLNTVDGLGGSPGIRRPTAIGVEFGLDCAATTRCPGGQRTVGWDGSLLDAGCAGDMSTLGACAVVGPTPGVWLHADVRGLSERDGGALTVAGPAGVAVREILPADWGAVEALWSPDGAHLLLLRRTGTGPDALWMLESDGRLRKLVEITGGFPGVVRNAATAIGWSPDGRYVTFQQLSPPLHGGTYELMTLIDLGNARTTQVGPALSGQFSWSSRGQLAFVDPAGGMSLWDGKEIRRVGPVPADRTAQLPVWDAMGDRLAWVESGSIVVFDGRERSELRCSNGGARMVRWSRESDALLVVCVSADARFDIWLWRLSGSGARMLPLVQNVQASSATFAWSRDAAIP